MVHRRMSCRRVLFKSGITKIRIVNVRITWHWIVFIQPLLQWRSNNDYMRWVCVCSLRYPACNADVPYCHLWPVRLCNIFPNYLINGTIFRGKVFWFSIQLLSETFIIVTIIKRDIIINVGARVGVVVKALRYKPAGRGFDSRWCHWNFSVT